MPRLLRVSILQRVKALQVLHLSGQLLRGPVRRELLLLLLLLPESRLLRCLQRRECALHGGQVAPEHA